MLCRDDDIALTGAAGKGDPLGGIEAGRVELARELLVLADGDAGAVHNPFADTGDLLALPDACGDGVEPPVDEHTEAGRTPPGQACVLAGTGALAGPFPDCRDISHVFLPLSVLFRPARVSERASASRGEQGARPTPPG